MLKALKIIELSIFILIIHSINCDRDDFKPSTGMEWGHFSPLPQDQGYAGHFAGESNGALLIAGGTNFPDKSVFDGGIKKWHDDIYVLLDEEGEWHTAGKLPRPLAYQAMNALTTSRKAAGRISKTGSCTRTRAPTPSNISKASPPAAHGTRGG